MSNTPSDAEIIMLAVEAGVSVRTGKGAVKLARAVLAKWGTPQPAPATQQAHQQEAQEPCGWPADRVRIEKTEKNGWCAYLDIQDEDGNRTGTINLCRGIDTENTARALVQNWMREFVPNPKQLAAPQQDALSDDVSQKTWALLDELEKLRGADRCDEDWDTLNKRDDELRAALAAQGGKA